MQIFINNPTLYKSKVRRDLKTNKGMNLKAAGWATINLRNSWDFQVFYSHFFKDETWA